MKAILDGEKIIKLSLSGEGIEIGDIPSGVDLNRLRWDGNRLIDLARLEYLHVKHIGNNFFEVFAMPDVGRQKIKMRYSQRKLLTIEGSIIRLKMVIEVEEEEKKQRDKAALKVLESLMGGSDKISIDLIMLVCALIVYVRTSNVALANLFDKMIPHIKDAFPLQDYDKVIMQSAKDIEMHVRAYNEKLKE
ncbi:MAG: hypothetical protein ACW97P_12030 [Candidatus Hodarchaeales archaeon]|jgi:hypothetical protein